MGRHKEFDREVVLDRALETFWSQGFEATSIQDLVERMGINRASLYDTFGDKQTLFLAALERYERVVARRLLDLLDGPGSGKEVIRAFFLTKIRFAAALDRPRGCLMTNSAVERSPHDPQTASRVATSLSAVEEAFYGALLRARRAGEIGKRRDLRALARFLVTCAQGLTVVSRVRPDPVLLRQVVDVTLAVLDA
jgi:TetR/AcrR family transcriptional regulator, transcriptional repressor for nem operon